MSEKRQNYPSVKQVFADPRMLLAFGLGSGLSRIMPGTMGTLMALPFLYLLAQLPLWAYLGLTILSCIVGVHLCAYASKQLNVHDHGGIVWDEFAGMWITMIAVPLTPLNLLVGFLLFRIFDMVKPWPISWLDKKVHGGTGIMLDDIVAGLLALLCMHLFLFYGAEWLQ